MLNGLQLFPQTVLDKNKGNFNLLTIQFISESFAKKSNFGKKDPKWAFLDLNNLFFSSSEKPVIVKEKQCINGHYMLKITLIFLKQLISMLVLLNDRELLDAHALFLNVFN